MKITGIMNAAIRNTIIVAMSLTLAMCGDDDDGLIKVDDGVHPVENLVGVLNNESGSWLFYPDSGFSNPFILGDCEGNHIEIKNWKDEYKEYAKGCMIQGSYRKIAVEPSKVEGVFASTNYYELTIDEIESYILIARSRSDVGNLLE